MRKSTCSVQMCRGVKAFRSPNWQTNWSLVAIHGRLNNVMVWIPLGVCWKVRLGAGSAISIIVVIDLAVVCGLYTIGGHLPHPDEPLVGNLGTCLLLINPSTDEGHSRKSK